ncbi:NB-ARC domain-containing protein [Nonomuraea sp. NPDC002799]
MRDRDAGSTVGTLLRRWRTRALLTQEQLAEQSGLNVRTVRRLETNELRQPRSTSLLLLAEALELDGDERATLTAAAHGRPASAGTDPAVAGPPPVTLPRQLPADVAVLAAREHELAIVAGHRSANTVTVLAINGMAGIGKTALAVHAAHRLAPRFPDGQLYVDLHGHAPALAPVAPEAALARMLHTLGIADRHIPAHADDRAALYRSVLAGRKILIVLDDATDEQQILPLLPAGRDCKVIVTSRRRLSRPVQARSLSLDVLPEAAAVALFTRLAGRRRIAGTPASELAETVRRCGLLPLALGIAAARLRARPAWDVRHLLDRLADDRLAELGTGRYGVAAALDSSYDRLPADERRAYRLLGSGPPTGFGLDTAAALLDTTTTQARRLVDQLLDAQLLQEPLPSRYLLHDLVRDHASSLSHAAPARPALPRGAPSRPAHSRATPARPAPSCPGPSDAAPLRDLAGVHSGID